MSNRFFRFGTWLAVLGLIVTSFGPLASHAAASTSFGSDFHSLQTPAVVINEFMSQPQSGNAEFVELYNPTGGAVDLTGWAIASESRGIVYTFPPSALLGPAGYAELTFANELNPTNDAIALINNFGATVDQIRYGQGADAQIAAPDQGKSDGRLADGGVNWYVDLAASPDGSNAAANAAAALPAQPASVWVKPGVGNRAHIINRSNMAATELIVMSGSTATASQTITGELLDRLGVLKAASAASPIGQGGVMVGAIDTTAASALTDGPVVVRALSFSQDGIASAYTYGPLVGRDTVAPAAPLSAQVVGTTGVSADNVINSGSVAAVSVQVGLPATSTNTDVLRVHLSDGVNVTSLDTPIRQAGGLMTVTMDASGLNDGVTYVQAWLLDSAGNPSAVLNGQIATKDTHAPDGTVTINGGATVTTGSTVSLSITASDTGTGVSQMRLANTNDFAGTNFEPFAATKTWQLIAGNGLRTVYVQFKDGAGNVSPARNVLSTNEALVDVQPSAQSIALVSLTAGTQTVRQLPAEATVTATSPTNATFGSFQTNPGGPLPAGLVQVGRFFEIGTSDPSKITFPVIVKLYYTTADLTAAGVTDANQLRGIAFANQTADTWQFYATTGVVDGTISVDGQTYAGYVYALADHLTPMTILADTTAPAVPGNVMVQSGDGQAVISWAAVSDASNYLVRYRRAGSSFAAVTVGSATNQVTITNLVDGASYDIQVASRDTAGNTSAFTGATVTPQQPVASPAATTAPKSSTTPPESSAKTTPAAAASPTPTISPSSKPTAASPSPTSSTNAAANGSASNYLIILAVLIIALGAGTAGWYGYQWWISRPGPRPPLPPAAGTNKPVPPAAPPQPPVRPPANQPPQPPAAPPPANSPAADKPTPPKEGRW